MRNFIILVFCLFLLTVNNVKAEKSKLACIELSTTSKMLELIAGALETDGALEADKELADKYFNATIETLNLTAETENDARLSSSIDQLIRAYNSKDPIKFRATLDYISEKLLEVHKRDC